MRDKNRKEGDFVKDIRLVSLSLKNFKGVTNFELVVNGNNATVLGDNGTGKTTLTDAVHWLFFDKDSLNQKDFEIKTLDENNQPIHMLDHEVEGVFAVDGKAIKLKKVYKEKWTKKRGQAKAEFTGHTTDYFVNDVPMGTQKEYQTTVDSIVSEDVFRLLTNPAYFCEQLPWAKRREVLLELCGDISQEEVIASDKALAKLPEILGDYKVEEYRNLLSAKRTAINDKLKKIPVRVDEAERNLPDVLGIDPKKVVADIERTQKAIEDKRAEIARIEQGGEIAEKRKALAEIETTIIKLKNEHSEKNSQAAGQKRQKLNDIQCQIDGFERAIEKAQHSIEVKQDLISEKEAAVQALRDEWYVVNEREFVFEQSDTCPTCGQALPAEQLQAARDKALAKFNQSKADALAEIRADGKALNAEIETLREEIAGLERAICDAEAEKTHLNSQAELLRQDITIIQSSMTSIEADPEYKKLMAEKASLEAAIDDLKANSREAIGKLQGDIYDLQVTLELLERKKRDLEIHYEGQARIEELKEEERKLAAEFEELEKQLYLTEEFIRAKVRLLEEKINSKFQMARFKLFNVLVNGGVEECCETVYNGVPYSNLNNGARLNIGLDVINTLAEHYGFAPPVWLDNAESVTDILSTKGQQIRLIVSEADKTLRVERDSEQTTLFKEVI